MQDRTSPQSSTIPQKRKARRKRRTFPELNPSYKKSLPLPCKATITAIYVLS